MQADGKLIAVLGAGPVGSILAASFLEAGEDVLLLESSEPRYEQIERTGLEIRGAQTLSARPRLLLRGIEELQHHPTGVLVICTKVWALRALLPRLAGVLGPETLIVSFQNGLGPEQEIAGHFAVERVARGVANFAGAVCAETGVVTMGWHNPPNYLGGLVDDCSPRLELLASSLERAGLSTRVVPGREVAERVFFKTILNSALSPLCAATGLTMSQAMAYRHTRGLVRRLLGEGLSVAAALGYDYGEDALDRCLRYLDAGGDHMPSMWTDLQRHCPTEIESMNGQIARIGLGFGNLRVDANLFFTAMIVTEEIKLGVRRPDDVPEYLAYA